MTITNRAVDPRDHDARDGDETMSETQTVQISADEYRALWLVNNAAWAYFNRHTDENADALANALNALMDAGKEVIVRPQARQRENDRLGLVALIEGAELRRRLEAAEKVVDEVRSEYPEKAWQVWRENFAKQPDEVTGSTHSRRIIRAVLAYDAARPTPDQEDE